MTPFKQNSRVAFIGDSITAANNYTARIADYYRKNLPELGVKFHCAGVSGGTVDSAMLYLEEDVLSFKPSTVTIMLGVNDSGRDFLADTDAEGKIKALNECYETYKIKMRELVDILTSRAIEVILCTPAPYAEFFTTETAPLKGGHTLIAYYAEAVRDLAHERGLELVDFHARLSELYLCEPLYAPDHVHPTDAGHARMADFFLAAQGFKVRDWVCGELAEPISAELAEWHGKENRVRNLYTAEWLIIKNPTLSIEEKMTFMRDLVENERPSVPYFVELAKAYLDNKPIESALITRIAELNDELF